MSKISIIVPVYNVEKYLRRCVNSILSQTYADFECILVDDGSTDQSGAICDEFVAIDNRIRVIHKKNGGLSDARNAGIDASKGAYLMFIDSDDYIDAEMIEKLYEAVQKYQADIGICNFSCVDEYDNLIDSFSSRRLVQNEVLSGHDALLRLFESESVCYVIAWNKIYKIDLFKSVRYPKGKIHEDEFVIHYLYEAAANVSCIAYSGYYYVQRNGSITSKRNMISRVNAREAILDRICYIDSIGEHILAGNAYFAEVLKCAESYSQFKTKNEKKEYRNLIKKYRKCFYLGRYSSIKRRIHLLLVLYFPKFQQLLISMNRFIRSFGR